jgi:hypothetical protein
VSCTPQPQKTPDEIETFSKLTDKTVALMHKFSVGARVDDVRTAIQDVLDAFAAAQPRIYAAVTRIAQSSGRPAIGDIDPFVVALAERDDEGEPAQDSSCFDRKPSREMTEPERNFFERLIAPARFCTNPQINRLM